MTRRAACRAVLALGWAIASDSHPWEEGAWARVATACELVPSALLNASSPCERGWERPSPAPREPGAAAALGACYASNASLPGTPHQLLREFCVPSVWLLGPEKTGTTALFYKLVQHPRVAAPVTYARAPGERPPGRASVVKETGFLELYLGKRGALQQYAAPECSLFSSTRRG